MISWRSGQTGTHTNECSRANLEAIARDLGDHATRKHESFDTKKLEIVQQFGLRSRRFSAALTAIRKSRPPAASVGLESGLRHLSDDKAVEAFELSAKAHPTKTRDREDLGIDYFDRDWGKFEEEARIARELDDTILELLTPEELADLEVLFYIGRDLVKGEHYDGYLERTIADHHAAASRWEGVHHLMSKANLLHAAVEGAAAVGRPSLAAKLRRVQMI